MAKRFRNLVYRTINSLRYYKLTYAEVLKNKVICEQAYEKKESKYFIMQVKMGVIDKVLFMLRQDRFLVYEYDYVFSIKNLFIF